MEYIYIYLFIWWCALGWFCNLVNVNSIAVNLSLQVYLLFASFCVGVHPEEV